MIEIIENKSKFFENDIETIILTEKINAGKVCSKVITMQGKKRVLKSIPYVKEMSSDYLINIFRLFSIENKNVNIIEAQRLIKKELKENYEDERNYFKLTLINEEGTKEHILKYSKYCEKLLNNSISMNSMNEIKTKDIFKQYNINNINIEKLDLNTIGNALKMTDLAYTQFIYLLAILLFKYKENLEVIEFMKNNQFTLEIAEVNCIDHYYLNNKLLFKTLLTHDASMNLEKEIIINSEWDVLKDQVVSEENEKKILFFVFNEETVYAPNHLISDIYYIDQNKLYIVNTEFNILKHLIY